MRNSVIATFDPAKALGVKGSTFPNCLCSIPNTGDVFSSNTILSSDFTIRPVVTQDRLYLRLG
jgi:hypothetical protein